VPKGYFQDIVKNISKNCNKDRISHTIYKSSLKESINKCIVKEVIKESNALCAKHNNSVLRNIKSEYLAKFKLKNLHLEHPNYAPLIHDIFKESLKGTTITEAIALKFRNLHMSSFHHVVAQILDHGGATDGVHVDV
jgi:hypothetical protein